MIDHISINVSDLAASRAFYEQALKPLGYEVIADFGKVIGFGVGTAGSAIDFPPCRTTH